MGQVAKCPLCGREIEPEAEVCCFCGSETNAGAFKKEPDGQPKKYVLWTVKALGPVLIALILVYLSDFLPEGEKRWLNWFFVDGRPLPPGLVLKIVFVSFVVLLACILKHRNL